VVDVACATFIRKVSRRIESMNKIYLLVAFTYNGTAEDVCFESLCDTHAARRRVAIPWVSSRMSEDSVSLCSASKSNRRALEQRGCACGGSPCTTLPN